MLKPQAPSLKLPRQRRRSLCGFTLVELLVVVTIIVVLLGLLIPGMNKAIYQAELAVCGTRLRAIGQGLTDYAMGQKRFFPERTLTASSQPAVMTVVREEYDFRPVLSQAMDLDLLNDPLTPRIDMKVNMGFGTVQTNHGLYANYNIWTGWSYPNKKGMDKIGDRFEWQGDKFSVLAGDRDLVIQAGAGSIQSSHPDRLKRLIPVQLTYSEEDPFNEGTVWHLPGARLTIGLWFMKPNFNRGAVDDNFVYEDLSVRRYNGVVADTKHSPGMTGVGIFRQHAANNTAQNWIHLPQE